MPEETKTEKTAEQKQEKARGDRGELGVATAGDTIKQMWRAAHFKRSDKDSWARLPGAPSLKKFARELVKSGNKVAKDWFDHKTGSLNAQRSEKNRGRISLESQASKAARRKKSQGKQAKATADAAAPAAVAAGPTKGKR